MSHPLRIIKRVFDSAIPPATLGACSLTSRPEGVSASTAGTAGACTLRVWAWMLLSFADKRLRAVCVDPESTGGLSATVIAALRTRVAELRAARVAAELLPTVVRDPGPPAAILVPLPDGLAMRWTVNDPVPVAADGRVDWDRVRRIQLRAIVEAA